ncbi:MAG: GH39 family glycosyl hydrolase [bacterium]
MRITPRHCSAGRVCLASLLFAAVLAAGPVAGGDGATGPAQTTWDPLARPVGEADTLFLPDLASVRSIEASGGFLHGHHDEGAAEIRHLFEFGQGRFGPAVRVQAEGVKHYWVWFPLDGLIPSEEFTIEFHAKSDRPWHAGDGANFFRINSGENEIAFGVHEGRLRVAARWPTGRRRWSVAMGDVGLKAGEWHGFAATLRQRTLRVYIDGVLRREFDGVRFEPLWSDGAGGAEGIQLGGSPWHSSNVWLSDVRISRTARAPGEAVALRSLESTLTVDAARPVGRVPPPYVGSLHPGQKSWPPSKHPGATPEQMRSALHVVRTDKFLQATPMTRGEPDEGHPSRGRSGRFSYDWQVVDRTLDWFKAHGVRPYISIDATPSLLGGSVEPFSGEKLRTALSRSSAFGPERPHDLDAWAAVVEDFVHHVVHERHVQVPWWGVWNEPDQPGFWNGTVEDYLALYEATVRAVRKVEPAAKVGGPESGLGGPWIEALVRRCAERKLPLDFVSYHDYSGDLNTLAAARAKVDGFTKAAGLKTPMPLIIGEFNWSGANTYKRGWPRFHRDFWHIRAFGAAYTTAFLTRAVDLPACELVVWSHTHYGDPRAGGWAATQLIGPRGEQWAPYNGLKGWKTVTGDTVLHTEAELAPGVFAAATRDSDSGGVAVVLANTGYAQRQARPVTIALKHLPEGHWHLRRWSVDPKHSSRWDVAEDRPEGAAHDDLERVAQAELHVEGPTPLVLRLTLPPWSSQFLLLERR